MSKIELVDNINYNNCLCMCNESQGDYNTKIVIKRSDHNHLEFVLCNECLADLGMQILAIQVKELKGV